MRCNYRLDADGRVQNVTAYPYSADAPSIEISDEDLARIHDMRLVDGALIYDPLPKPTPLPDPASDMEALLIDHEERLILLELEV